MKKLLAVAALAVACSHEQPKPPETPVQAAPPAAAPAPLKEMTVTTKSPDARAAYEQGRDLVENARMGEAAAPLKKALELDPSFALAHAAMASVVQGDERNHHAE